MDCARAIVQAGIARVIVDADRMRQYSSKRYDEEFKKVKVLFKEAGIKLEVISGHAPGQKRFSKRPAV
jgi:deoxycytidylate deaminase